jgi:hypothetical protein
MSYIIGGNVLGYVGGSVVYWTSLHVIADNPRKYALLVGTKVDSTIS